MGGEWGREVWGWGEVVGDDRLAEARSGSDRGRSGGRSGVLSVQGAAKGGPGNAQAAKHAGTRSHDAWNEGFVRWGMVTKEGCKCTRGVSLWAEQECVM